MWKKFRKLILLSTLRSLSLHVKYGMFISYISEIRFDSETRLNKDVCVKSLKYTQDC